MSPNKRHLVKPALAQERRGVVQDEPPVDDREELACTRFAVHRSDDRGQRRRAEARHRLGRVVWAPDCRGHVGEAELVGRGVGKGISAGALNNLRSDTFSHCGWTIWFESLPLLGRAVRLGPRRRPTGGRCLPLPGRENEGSLIA